MPILAALTKALPYITTAWSLYAQSKQKPEKADYVPTGSMYNRWVAYLKSKTVESTVYHQRMRPALRQIGAQTQRGQRKVGYQVARDKPGGGIEAQMRMGINRQALEAIGIASEKASIAQEQVNIRTGEQLLRIGVREEAALQRYQRDKQRFTQQMFASTVSAGLSLASISAKSAAARTTATDKVIEDAETTIAKSDEAIKTDYNVLPESVREETSFEVYLQDVRARATEITTKLVEPTKDDIEYRRGAVEAARKHRKQFKRGTEDWKTADKMVQSAKENLRTAKTEYGTAQRTYRADIDKYVTVEKESTGVGAPMVGTVSQVSTALSDIYREQFKKEEAFAKDEEKEALLDQSVKRLSEFNIATVNMSQQEAHDLLFKEYAEGMIPGDISKAITKIGSLKGAMDPLTRKIAITRTTTDIKSAEKNLAEAVEIGTVKQITDAGSAINAIDSRKIAKDELEYRQETRQTAKDKKIYDAKAEKTVLRNNRNSLIEYFALGNTKFPISIPGPMGAGRQKAYNQFIETVKGIDTDKGMKLSDAIGLKRSIRKYISFIEIDSQSDKNALAIALKLDEDWDRWEELTKGIVGVDAKQVSTFALEVMKRIDALFEKRPYEGDLYTDDTNPLGLVF